MGYKDLTGLKFGRLVCITPSGRYEKGRNIIWKCVCDCGKIVNVIGSKLITGNTKSCGCLQKEIAAENGRNSKTHGMTNTVIYKHWAHMKERCLNPHCKDYKNYGGRGIKVCNEWLSFEPFYNWAMANGYQKGLTLERMNNDKSYNPFNCKWATRLEQNNNSRNNRKISYKCKTLNLSQWAEIKNIHYKTLYSRLFTGWSIEKALETPISKKPTDR